MNTVIVGAYWGDEGKGKIVDMLASDAAWVARFNGGDNAGHTINVSGREVVLHVLPSGAVSGRNVAIGPDVFFNPKTFFADLDAVKQAKFSPGRILVDERCHLIMPYHLALDSGGQLGTTKRGIGPVAKDKASRTEDITVHDLVFGNFREKVHAAVLTKAVELGIKDVPEYVSQVVREYSQYAAKLRPFVGSCVYEINDALAKSQGVILEGAQATLLDIVHGTRPFVTSSNCTAGGAAANMGVDIRKFRVIGIAKAYPTRVGEGPFPTELGSYEQAKLEKKGLSLTPSEKKQAIDGNSALMGRWLRQDGREFGATTGRPRRTGWPDFVALKYAALVNSVDEWVITKIDILSGKPFRAAIAYEKDGKKISRFPFSLAGCKPVYGPEFYWPAGEINAASYDDLPAGMKAYIKALVVATGVPVSMVSVGPERHRTIVKDVLKRTGEYL